MQPQPIANVWTGGQQSLARIAFAVSALLMLLVIATDQGLWGAADAPNVPDEARAVADAAHAASLWQRVAAVVLLAPALTLLVGWRSRASALLVGVGLMALALGRDVAAAGEVVDPAARVWSLGDGARLIAAGVCVGAALVAARLDEARRTWPAALAVVAGVVALGPLGVVAAPAVWIVTAPAAPWGSLDAAGRIDPGGDWRRPAWHGPAARGVAFALLLRFALPLLLVSALWLWMLLGAPLQTLAAMTLAVLIWVAPLATLAWPASWPAPLPSDGLDVVFYDGHCGLCHRTVRWLLAEDPDSARFAFAALGGETFLRRLDAADRGALPDSVVVLTHDGRLLTRWRAVCHLLARLGGLWRLLGDSVDQLMPRRLGDALYDLVARVRLRIFGRSDDACPLLPPQLRARMLP